MDVREEGVEVDLTAKAIREASSVLRRAADDLEAKATRMLEDGDLDRATEAMQTVVNCYSNLRLDLFVGRPIREFHQHLMGDQRARENQDGS